MTAPNRGARQSPLPDGAQFHCPGAVIDDAKIFSHKLQEWEDYYSFHRPHGSLGGQTPYERLRQKTEAPV